MDQSTDGVTLFAGFIFAILDQYKPVSRLAAPLVEFANTLDPSNPAKPVSMAKYNELCDWIEQRHGPASIRDAGRAIGNEAYGQMVKDHALGAKPTPLEIMEQLKRVASLMIQDPKGRGWELVDKTEGRILMRRTQTFNCMLQEGLLLSLLERTGVVLPQVIHVRCTRKGAPFCEYEVKWLVKHGKSATSPRPA